MKHRLVSYRPGAEASINIRRASISIPGTKAVGNIALWFIDQVHKYARIQTLQCIDQIRKQG